MLSELFVLKLGGWKMEVNFFNVIDSLFIFYKDKSYILIR